MVDHLNRLATRPADFLTINKQTEQLGEVRHGRQLVVKPDLERLAAVAGALLNDLGNRNLLFGVRSADILNSKLPSSSHSETSARSVDQPRPGDAGTGAQQIYVDKTLKGEKAAHLHIAADQHRTAAQF